MKVVKPVAVSKGGFTFCKWSVAILVAVALISQQVLLLWLTLLILAASALLKVRRAPMVWIYTQLFEGGQPQKTEILDEKAMVFAHTLGTVINLVCLVLYYFVSPTACWIMTVVFLAAKTMGACGHCSGVKLYQCLNNEDCCKFVGRNA